MGCVPVPVQHQVISHLEGEVGAVTDSFAASDVALGPALLPLVALAASLVAAVAVGTLIVAWLRKPEMTGSVELADPTTAGLLSVGFASGTASQRWLPATVVQLACDHVITIDDRRGAGNGAGDGKRSRDVRLVFGVPDAAAKGAIATERVVPGPAYSDPPPPESVGVMVAAVFLPGMSAGSLAPVPGSSVDVGRVVARNGPLTQLTRDRFIDAAGVYREPRPVARFRAASIGGVLGVVLGIVSLWQDAGANSIAWSAIIIGAVALGLRVLLPGWIPLNATGLLLRERANELREAVATAEVPTLAAGEQVLPWAVLFDEHATIRRVAEAGEVAAVRETADAADAPPIWYRTTEPFTADRFASCLAMLTSELSQPILVGPKLPWANEGGRFGVPGLNDYIWRTDGYFGSYRNVEFGGFGVDGGTHGTGFDGGYGGFDGGGFDGGGSDGGGGN